MPTYAIYIYHNLPKTDQEKYPLFDILKALLIYGSPIGNFVNENDEEINFITAPGARTRGTDSTEGWTIDKLSIPLNKLSNNPFSVVKTHFNDNSTISGNVKKFFSDIYDNINESADKKEIANSKSILDYISGETLLDKQGAFFRLVVKFRN